MAMTIQCERSFRPGETVRGTISWQLDAPPRALELSLLWHTVGKGTEDITVVDRHRIESPHSLGQEKFAFLLPITPYSFSGTLISLEWVLELVAEPSGESHREALTVSPSGREVDLRSPPPAVAP